MEKELERIKKFLAVGSGYGDGDGDGDGYGDGYGSGYGSGYGFGDGYGDGDGSGSGISDFNGQKVWNIDGVPTIIKCVVRNVAKGFVLNTDFTLAPCYIARIGNSFAHGESIREAMRDAMVKEMQKLPIEERISKSVKQYPDPDVKIPARSLWHLHHVLTCSCEAGRNAFARDHGIDIDHDALTIREFVTLTSNSYGSDNIRKFAKAYGITL